MPGPEPDHYQILGVARNATAADIKRAFKKKALYYHPDKNPNGEALFKQINAAYSVLVDEKRRSEYDRLLTSSFAFSTGPSAFSRTRPTSSFAQRGGAMPRSRQGTADKEPNCGRPFSSSSNFSSWFGQKTKEFQEAEEKARAEERRREAKRAEEEREAERQRVRQKEEEEARRREQSRRDQLQREKEMQKRLEEDIRQQQQASTSAERHLERLREERDRLQREKDLLAADLRGSRQGEGPKAEDSAASWDARAWKLHQEQTGLTEKLGHWRKSFSAGQEEAEPFSSRLEPIGSFSEDVRSRKQRLKEMERRDQEELLEGRRRRAEEERREQYLELERRSQAFLREVQEQKRRHREDLLHMRAEADRMEKEARAALEAMRLERSRLGVGSPTHFDYSSGRPLVPDVSA
eukprot:GGOE01005494.1.p2 GENE.GGOE01005494.1~~GGOE01005494.1.p2  ORF type:complete len:408 (-),score=151.81 GGOE01005494.1:456-1679(-)